RDFRSIGHKAIFLANGWRTLQTIGWEHAEPVLRSLAYAMLNHNGEPNPATSDLAPDRSWKSNQQLAAKFRDGWESGTMDSAATTELLTTLRTGTADNAATLVVELVNRQVSPQSIYDALHLAAGELLMRQSGIVPLHAATTTNALRFLFDHRKPQTRNRCCCRMLHFCHSSGNQCRREVRSEIRRSIRWWRSKQRNMLRSI
ncbi:MAG: hypothetical protein WKF77_21535, partial [Planctomycetaceae bacterium]